MASPSGSRNVPGTWGSSDLTASNGPLNRGTAHTICADQAGGEIDLYVAAGARSLVASTGRLTA